MLWKRWGKGEHPSPRRGAAHACSALSSRERTVSFTWRGFGSHSLLGQQGAVVLSWMCPSESPVAQPLSHRAGGAPAVPPPKPSSAWWQQHWAKHSWFKGCMKHNRLPSQPVILFMPFLHENLLNPTTIMTNKGTNMKTNKRWSTARSYCRAPYTSKP